MSKQKHQKEIIPKQTEDEKKYGLVSPKKSNLPLLIFVLRPSQLIFILKTFRIRIFRWSQRVVEIFDVRPNSLRRRFFRFLLLPYPFELLWASFRFYFEFPLDFFRIFACRFFGVLPLGSFNTLHSPFPFWSWKRCRV